MAIFTKHQNFKPVATYTMMAALLWATVLTVYAQELTPLLREKIKLEHRSSSVIPSPVTIQNHQAVTQGRFLIETSQASTAIIPET